MAPSPSPKTLANKMITKLQIILLISAFANSVLAQNCTIGIRDDFDFLKKNFNEELEVFLSLEFEINKVQLKANDSTAIVVSPNKVGFDTINYSFMYRDSMYSDQFICKLRAGETYTISPCTCCGIFLMTPSQNAERGFVKYVNNSNRTFMAETGELEIDTLYKRKETDFIHSSISMNCGFRPNNIFVADFDYLDKKFDYENWKNKTVIEQNLLKKEQQSHILFSFNYLFLHAEKLTVTINKTGEIYNLTLE